MEEDVNTAKANLNITDKNVLNNYKFLNIS